MEKDGYSEEEIEALIASTERALIRFAAWYLGDRADACDAVQSAYIRYVRFLQGPPPGVVRNPAAWLFRTTRNICLDVLKSARMRLTTPLEEAQRCDSRAAVPGSDDALLARDDLKLVCSVFETLSGREREIAVLKIEHGKSYREIAEITNLTVSNVGFILHGAMKKLRSGCKEKGLL